MQRIDCQRCMRERFIWNPSNCKCECDKSCDIGEYLDYENSKCRKKLFDKLVEEYTETNNEVKLTKITLAEMKISINAVLAHCTLHCVIFNSFYN